MATFFGSPPFVSHPVVRTQHLSSSSQSPPPPPPPPPQPPQPPSQPPSLSKSSQELQVPLPVALNKAQRVTSAESTDWIASSLTRRFGLGAGLAWAGFLAFGVVSEQVKTRFEVTQQEANTRSVLCSHTGKVLGYIKMHPSTILHHYQLLLVTFRHCTFPRHKRNQRSENVKRIRRNQVRWFEKLTVSFFDILV